MRQNKNIIRASEFGGMLLYILVGVVLFGLLLYVYTKTSSSSTGMATKGQAKTIAANILDQANAISAGTEKLMMKGCSETTLNFLTPAGSNPNTSAPADHSCDIFNVNGGNVTWKAPPKKTQIEPYDSNSYFHDYWFQNIFTWPGAGSDTCEDFLLTIVDVNPDVCLAIDKSLGMSSIPVLGTWYYAPQGKVVACAGSAPFTSDPVFKANKAMCFLAGGGAYVFSKVLISR